MAASGGSAGNTAAGLASLGAKCAYIGRVRDDQLGEIFAHDIRAVGAEYATAPATDGPATARCLVLITPDAECTLNTYLGACADLGPDDIDDELIDRAKVTYLEGYLWDRDAAKQAFLKAARLARSERRGHGSSPPPPHRIFLESRTTTPWWNTLSTIESIRAAAMVSVSPTTWSEPSLSVGIAEP